jgi:hypothetical protein
MKLLEPNTKYGAANSRVYSVMTLKDAIKLIGEEYTNYGETKGHWVVFDHSGFRICQVGDSKIGSLNTLGTLVGIR